MIDKILMTKRTKNCMKNNRERGNRPKTHKDEKQRKKILSQTSVVLMNYFSCLSFTYLKVVGMTNTKVRAKQLIEFMDFNYQMISELLENMYPAVFASLPMMINAQCDYDRKFFYQASPFSLQRELLRIRKQRQANSKEQFEVLHITKTQIKNMFLIKLLLEGVEQIDLPVLKNGKNQSIQQKIKKKVSWLLNRTSILRTTNFQWLRTNWNWVIETVVKQLADFDQKRKSDTYFSSNFSDSTSVKKSIEKHTIDKDRSSDSYFQMQNGVLSFGSKQNIDQTPQQQSIDLEQTENIILHQSSNQSLIQDQFCYEQVEGQIENFIEAFNYLKLSTLNPDEIEIDSEEKCVKHNQKVERQIKIRQKQRIQEANKKKKQADQMVQKIKQKIRQEQKSSTSKTKQKKPIKKKAKQFRPLYDHTAESQSIGGSQCEVQGQKFRLGSEGPMEFEMLNESDGYLGLIQDDAEQENLNDQQASQGIEVKQKTKRTRSNMHNVSEIDKIITNILSRPQQIGTVISSQLYHTLIATNFRLIQDHQPQKQNSFLD